MVHVPILKIDIPEPRLSDLIPSTIELVINTLTIISDRVDDFINPVPPEHAELFSELAVGAIPKEFRKARKRLIERKEKDEDKISEELEDAAFAYYRRSMRETWVGSSDEMPEEVGFGRLIDGDSASQQVLNRYEFQQEQLMLDGLPPGMESLLLQDDSEAPVSTSAGAHQSADQPAGEEDVILASTKRQLATTTAAGGAGVALGIGVLRLLQVIRRFSKRGRQKGSKGVKQQAAAGGKVRKGGKGSQQQQQQRAGKPKARDSSKRRAQR
jgi:hypothetical protein